MIVKIGPKDRHMAVPSGWRIVRDGPSQEGDMYASLLLYKWVLVDEFDEGMQAGDYDCLIRKGLAP